MKLYIGNLPYSVTDKDIEELLADYGTAKSIQLITDRHTGQSKGFGFIEMSNNSEADSVIKALNETEFKGRKLKVNQAQPRGERPNRNNNRRRY
ncbi:MAG: RNA-binding protein [Thiomargarita sp.]|nr:RNA-binding protein [Thiomargarita sp.]